MTLLQNTHHANWPKVRTHLCTCVSQAQDALSRETGAQYVPNAERLTLHLDNIIAQAQAAKLLVSQMVEDANR